MIEPNEIEWFERWFNSPYYHLLYGNRDDGEARKFLDRLLAHEGIPKQGRVLDLACGKGRHAKHINSLGYEVIGIDLSENSISEAQKAESESLDFFVHDMRQLFWKEHFELVVNLFTSFGYFHNSEDDERMMQGVFDSLKPGGVFVIDFMNAKKVVANLVDHEEKSIEGVQFIIDRKVESGMIEKSIQVVDGETKLRFVEEVDELYRSDFEELLINSGFSIQDAFGDYNLSAFEEELSDRLIIVATKSEHD